MRDSAADNVMMEISRRHAAAPGAHLTTEGYRCWLRGQLDGILADITPDDCTVSELVALLGVLGAVAGRRSEATPARPRLTLVK